MAATHMPDSICPGRVSPAQVELILSRIESLPTLPAIAGRLLEMTVDDRVGTGQIAALIGSDQSLSARVLSMVRKSSVGVDVQTVDRAVVLLGADAVRSIVLGVQIFEAFARDAEPESSGFDRVAFWHHSLAVACAARLMAEKRLHRLGSTQAARHGWLIAGPEEAFVCGLLHDLGKMVFDSFFPKGYGRVIEAVEARRADIADVEREVFGVDHAIAGHRLAMHWKLPKSVAECMWLHHQTPQSTPTRIEYPDHVMLVQAADRFARRMGIGYSGNYGSTDLPEDVLEMLGLARQDLDEITLALPDAIEARAEVLGLQRITSREVLQESLLRTNAELVRVNTELALANRGLEQRSRTLDAVCALNRALGDDCRHESVANAVVRAFRALVPSTGVAVVVASKARELTMVAALPAGEQRVRTEILPSATAGWTARAFGDGQTVSRMSGYGAGGRFSTAVSSAESLIPAVLVDRLAGMLMAGDVGTRYCRPIPCGDRLAGAIIATEPVGDDVDRSLELIADWAASWIKTAEAASVNQQLSEELAEINRRQVNAQAEVARMRSLAMVGEMAAGAAHELNNPLAVISGRAQLLARGEHEESVTRSASIIAEHAHRASAIVNELMEFAKPAPAQPADWKPDGLLNEIRQCWLQKNEFSPDQFSLQLSDDLPYVRADASQIRLLFDEIIRNAVEAMPHRDTRRLTVNCHGHSADEKLVVRIEDNGCGMTPDVAERAMDPFFSHRPAGRGRGLGLSRAARYAEINGGRIRLSSRVKEGTAVIVELPAAVAE